ARVWTDRDTGLRCHQQYAEDLVHTAQPAGVDLTEADRVGLEKLLEDDAVLTVLAGGDPYRRDCPGDGRVAEDVIRAGGLLDPPGVEAGQLAHPGDRLIDVPGLVGIDHQLPVGPDLLANERDAS